MSVMKIYFRVKCLDIPLVNEKRNNNKQRLLLIKKAGSSQAHVVNYKNQMWKETIIGWDVCFAVDGVIGIQVNLNKMHFLSF